MEWEWIDSLLELRTKWVSFVGEKWRDDKGVELEYWRVEKPDSVIVLPIQENFILLPKPSFRPGVKSMTLDFPGGRVDQNAGPEKAALKILDRELGIGPSAVLELNCLNEAGWFINSSFSNQKLYAYVAEIDVDFSVPLSLLGHRVSRDMKSLSGLLEQLECLQCRSVLLEWARQQYDGEKH